MESKDLIMLFERYRLIMQETQLPFPNQDQCGRTHLIHLCHEAIFRIETTSMPYGKVCRWLGFIQGVLCSAGIITVEQERDFTRPIFQGNE
jgi:hypothetical protein